jgi:phage terminase large subunit
MDLVERVYMLQQADQTNDLQATLLELCRRDPIYWFNNFAWTFDPRAEITDMPFNLYPYQEWCIREWYACIENQEDFGVEKSRDMGVSWMLILLFQYCWLFRPGWNFHVGSRKEAEVDTASIDPSTLFGKFRYNLYRLPRWMRPPADKVNDKKLHIQNLINGNLLTGESANPSFGRGARQRAILTDELAFWDCADMAWGGISATTNCRIAVSTPCGETNRYAQLMNDPRNELQMVPGEYLPKREFV